ITPHPPPRHTHTNNHGQNTKTHRIVPRSSCCLNSTSPQTRKVKIWSRLSFLFRRRSLSSTGWAATAHPVEFSVGPTTELQTCFFFAYARNFFTFRENLSLIFFT
ncbi:unnamed protein product, partial [Ectocarpus sp. 4 AP-2014]